MRLNDWLFFESMMIDDVGEAWVKGMNKLSFCSQRTLLRPLAYLGWWFKVFVYVSLFQRKRVSLHVNRRVSGCEHAWTTRSVVKCQSLEKWCWTCAGEAWVKGMIVLLDQRMKCLGGHWMHVGWWLIVDMWLLGLVHVIDDFRWTPNDSHLTYHLTTLRCI